MAKKHEYITEDLRTFIEQQPIFFVATAADGRINISPKGLDSLRVTGSHRVVWLNLTGSGNETATHLLSHPRMTLLFPSFGEQPKNLRLFGTARTLHEGNRDWEALRRLFPAMEGERQIFDLSVDLVMTSCGFSVPQMEVIEERTERLLVDHFSKLGKTGTRLYQQKKNLYNIEGMPSDLHPDNQS